MHKKRINHLENSQIIYSGQPDLKVVQLVLQLVGWQDSTKERLKEMHSAILSKVGK